MTSVAERIRHARKKAGLTQADLAKACGISRAAVSQWELGTTKSPTSQNIFEIARATGFNPEWLSSGQGSDLPSQSNVAEARPPSISQQRLAPIISWVQAGDWSEAVDAYARGYGEGYEPIDATDGPHVFWLRVKGDSMTSPTGVSIPEGYLIKVDPDARAESGSLVVAKLEDTQEVTFKKLVIDAGQKYLKPLNPAYRTIPINGNCRVVGVVKEVRLKL